MHRNAWPLLGAATFALLGCASHPSLKERLVNAERRATEADRLLDQAEYQMQALDADEADSTLKQAERAVSDPDFGYYPEHQAIAQRYGADLKRLPQVRKEREAKELAIAVGKRRAEVEKVLAEFEPAIAALKKPELAGADIDRANERANALKDALNEGKELEVKDANYGLYAKHQYRLLEQSRLEMELGKVRLEFAGGPGKTRQQALEVSKRATLERDRRKQAKLRTKARQMFAACANEGQGMLARFPKLAAAVTKMGDEELSPQRVVKSCTERAKEPKAARPKLARKANRKT